MILLVIALTTATVDLDREKCAIAIVETADKEHPLGNDAVVGPRGELGRYQIKRITWRQHSDLPFEWAIVEAEENYVAEEHLKWLGEHLEFVTPYTLALAWKAGLKRVRSETYTLDAIRYARRVNAIYKELH